MYKYNKLPKKLEQFELLLVEYKPRFMNIHVNFNNIQIEDSYQISKYNFRPILQQIWKDLPNHSVVRNRSLKSVEREWVVHNFCYELGIYKERSKHLDINYPLTWIESLIYDCCGWFCRLFIS